MKLTTTLSSAALVLAVALSVGCDSEVELVSNSGNTTIDNTQTGDDTHDHNHDQVTEPEGTVEAGAFTGSWRVATVDGDAPAVYIDLLHAADEAELSGDFKMGPAIVERLDGQTGPIISGTATDGSLEVKFNPTTDPEEVYTLSATGAEPMTGTITAKKNTSLNMQVTVAPLPTE